MSDEIDPELLDDPVPDLGPVVVPAPPPPPSALSEVDRLQRIAEEAMQRLHHLKAARRDALQEYERLEDRIREAEAAADEAMTHYRAVKPLPPLPPAPTYDECMAMAIAQRPGANIEDTKRLAAQLHSTMSDGQARAGMGYNRPIPPMEGPEVRDMADTRYDLHGPDKDAPPGRQHIGTVKRYPTTNI